uniref:Retroviral nucleocapsid Gag protein p24 C-terminal domain-containing protein n=1 Tax=Suricata suricatta TaxID=37032 RepID=A0A673U9C2_SURSU
MDTGHLTPGSWNKLGKDLERADSVGSLPPGVIGLWTVVNTCLQDPVEVFQSALRAAAEVLEEVKELRLAIQEGSASSSDSDSCDDLETISKAVGALRVHPQPSAPTPPPYDPGGEKPARYAYPGVWAQAPPSLGAFPVFQDPQGQRFHEPLEWKKVSQLAEAVRVYGHSAAFTLVQLESLHRFCMTPGDWQNLAKACLTAGQYLDWKLLVIELAVEQAAANQRNGQPAWDVDMLLGQGCFANQQTGHPQVVYDQINGLCTKAWRMLPNKGQPGGNLTKILQGANESFSDFVARMVEAAGKVFGDVDTAMPLVKQLIYEQCTGDCRKAISPYKSKGLEVWMKICREMGGLLTNSGLAATV